jgi:hypothetical protein
MRFSWRGFGVYNEICGVAWVPDSRSHATAYAKDPPDFRAADKPLLTLRVLFAAGFVGHQGLGCIHADKRNRAL